MELSNEFEVAVPVDQAWAVLTDIERIAPCLPGAQLQEIDGDQYKGIVKIKVGPITAQYKGAATFIEKDDSGHRAVLTASGRDTRGQGNASATIVAELVARGDDTTHVSVLTDLSVTGKVAQFGRGVMADVSAKLLDQFVQNLETTVLAHLGSGDAEANDADADTSDSDSDSDATVETGTAEPDTGTDATEAVAEAADAATGAATTDAPAAAAESAAAEAATGTTAMAAPSPPGEVARKAKSTTEMLASELAKAWEEAKESTDDAAGGETPRVEREPLAPRPDLLVPEAETPRAEASAASAESTNATPVRRLIDSPEAEPIDLLGAAGSPVLQRAAPLLGLVAAVLVLLALVRRHRRRR